MDMTFLIAQLIGAVAFIILIFSFQKDDAKKLFRYQIASSLFFSIQYLLLNAMSGFFINIVGLFRNYVFSKCDKKVPFIWIFIVIFIMLLIILVSFDGLHSILPIIAGIIYTIALGYKNLKFIRIAEIISCILFIIYNIYVYAFVGIVSSIIELAFGLIAVYRFDIKRDK